MTRFAILSLLVLVPAITSHADDTWPGFRGRGNSLSEAKNLPVSWELRGRMGWTARLTGYGQSSPVAWKKQVFVTSVSGDEKENLHITAIDLDTGHPIWVQ